MIMDFASMRGVLFVHILLMLVVEYAVVAEINHSSETQKIEQGSQNFSGSPSAASTSKMNNWKKDCSKSYNSMCLKLDLISLVDRLAESNDFAAAFSITETLIFVLLHVIGILPGISVVRQNDTAQSSSSDIVATLARDFPNDADKRTDAYLVHKIGAYLGSHAISIRLFDPRTFEATRNFSESVLEQLGLVDRRDGNDGDGDDNNDGNGKDNVASARKKDKGGHGMMAGLMMMKGTLGALAFGALAMLAGKALMTGLMALMLSAIVGLKSLHHDKKTTYEIVTKPVHTVAHHSTEDIHAGYSAGYARSLEYVREAIEKHGNVRDRRAAGYARAGQ